MKKIVQSKCIILIIVRYVGYPYIRYKYGMAYH